MKLVKKAQTKKFKNSNTCIAFEYPIDDNDINAAVIVLKGRYPEKGRVVNTNCKELVYVIKGNGKVVVEGKEYVLEEGDMALLLPNEKYYWEGNMTILIPSTPAWNPTQHKEVE